MSHFLKLFPAREVFSVLSIMTVLVCAIMYMVAFDRYETAILQWSFWTGIVALTVFLTLTFDGAVKTSPS